MKLRQIAKRHVFILLGYKLLLILKNEYGFNVAAFLRDIRWYHSDYKLLKQSISTAAVHCDMPISLLHPCLRDKTSFTPIEYTYFYQDTWAAKQIFDLAPEHHFDVGSSVKSMALISQRIPVTMVDIRPPEVVLDGFDFIKGSILSLPFNDGSIVSLSSLCVVEHIGLGRYGDPIDPSGSEKAASELSRVLAPGGHLFFSVPVDSDNRVYFNAHRAFTRSRVLGLFPGLNLVEDAYIYGSKMYDQYDVGKGFGTGLFHFTNRGSEC